MFTFSYLGCLSGLRTNLFDAEMKYLYHNGFKVITMADVGYDEDTNCYSYRWQQIKQTVNAATANGIGKYKTYLIIK